MSRILQNFVETRVQGLYFCKGPLIWYDFRFLNLQNKGPTVTVTHFIILTAPFQAVTGT